MWNVLCFTYICSLIVVVVFSPMPLFSSRMYWISVGLFVMCFCFVVLLILLLNV